MTKCHLHFRPPVLCLDCDVMGPPPAEARGSPATLSGTRSVFDYLDVCRAWFYTHSMWLRINSERDMSPRMESIRASMLTGIEMLILTFISMALP